MKPGAFQNGPWRAWLICFAGAAAATAGVYFAVLDPVLRHRREEAAVARQADEQAREAQRLQDAVDRLHAELNTVRAQLDDQQIKLGDAGNLNQRIAWLIQLARRSGLEVIQLQPGGEQSMEHYNLRALRLDANGTLEDHTAFLGKLYGAFPDMSVVGIEMTQASGQQIPRPRAVFSIVWFTAIGDDPTADAGTTPDNGASL